VGVWSLEFRVWKVWKVLNFLNSYHHFSNFELELTHAEAKGLAALPESLDISRLLIAIKKLLCYNTRNDFCCIVFI
jgi:hypothetical protein